MRSRREVEHEVDALLAQPISRQFLRARNSTKLRTRAFVEAAAQRAFTLRHSNPRAMLALALAATDIAKYLKDNETLALALAHLGNALKCNGRFSRGLSVLRGAASLRPSAPNLRALVFEFQASILIRVGQPEEARRMIHSALALRDDSDLHARAACLLFAAYVASEAGDPEEALDLTCSAILLMPAEDTQLRLTAHHNACFYLLELNEPEEAHRAFADIQFLYKRLLGSTFEAQREHLSAHIELSLGNAEGAEAGFRSAIALYLQLGAADLAAVPAIELYGLLSTSSRLGVADVELVASIVAGLDLTLVSYSSVPAARREKWRVAAGRLTVELPHLRPSPS